MAMIIEKMAMLVILLVLGYVCARLKIVGPEFNKGLSKLVINLFLCATIIDSVSNKEMALTGADLLYGIGMMFLLMVINAVVGYFSPQLCRIKDGDRGMYRLLVSFMNAAFIGYPIIQAIYGTEALFFASTSNIPFNLLLYTYGIILLQKQEGKTRLRVKDIVSPPVIATLIAVIIFAFRIPIPLLIDDTIGTLAGATIPLSMMVVGTSLGTVSLKEAFTGGRLYLLSFVRLIVCPVVTWLVLKPLVTDDVMLGTLVILAATPMPVIATVLGIEHGRDGIESSKAIFMSTLMSMITIPALIFLMKL